MIQYTISMTPQEYADYSIYQQTLDRLTGMNKSLAQHDRDIAYYGDAELISMVVRT